MTELSAANAAPEGDAERTISEARARLQLGSQLLALGDANASLAQFRRSARQFEACGDEVGLAQAETGRLQVLSDLQQWGEIDSGRRILAITEGDQAPQARAARLIALIYLVQALTAREDHAGAASTAIQAADLASELEQRELEARQLTERYAVAGDQRMEALCRYQLALCLERIRPAQHAECGAQYAHAARLFDLWVPELCVPCELRR